MLTALSLLVNKLHTVCACVCVLFNSEHPNGVRVGLHNSNLLLRSCTIRNTETVVGIVVYAGKSSAPPTQDLTVSSPTDLLAEPELPVWGVQWHTVLERCNLFISEILCLEALCESGAVCGFLPRGWRLIYSKSSDFKFLLLLVLIPSSKFWF